MNSSYWLISNRVKLYKKFFSKFSKQAFWIKNTRSSFMSFLYSIYAWKGKTWAAVIYTGAEHHGGQPSVNITLWFWRTWDVYLRFKNKFNCASLSDSIMPFCGCRLLFGIISTRGCLEQLLLTCSHTVTHNKHNIKNPQTLTLCWCWIF